jgi:hypothetical protein
MCPAAALLLGLEPSTIQARLTTAHRPRESNASNKVQCALCTTTGKLRLAAAAAVAADVARRVAPGAIHELSAAGQLPAAAQHIVR